MLRASDDLLDAFCAHFPDVADAEIPPAYERFRRYANLAAEIAQTAPGPNLTTQSSGVTVWAGQVDPIRTFTNTG